MITNASQKLINHNNGIEGNTEEANNIKMSAEFRESSYTRNGWDGEVTLDGFKLRIKRKDCNDVTAKYIRNVLKKHEIYNKVEITQDETFIEFEMWIFGEWDICRSVMQLEKSLYDTKEKMQEMLKVFEIDSFELIGLFYYAPAIR